MDVVGESLPLAVLDFVGIEHGESASASVAGAVRIAQAVEAAGYRRYWVSEHHNMTSLACSAPELLTAHVGARTSRIRVGAAGIMLPNHAPLKVAETFRTLLAMYPGRIDLALGRAPGTDPLTAHVLRRGMVTDPAAEFPGQVGELLAFLGDGFPAGHPYAQLVAAPLVDERPELFVLGSSPLRATLRRGQRDECRVRPPHEPRSRVRGAAGLPPRVHAACRGRDAVLGDVGAGLRQRRQSRRSLEFEAAWTLTIAEHPPRDPRAAAARSRCASFARSRAVPRQPAPTTAGW